MMQIDPMLDDSFGSCSTFHIIASASDILDSKRNSRSGLLMRSLRCGRLRVYCRSICGVERRRLGRTEHESSVAVLGAAAFARCTAEEAAEGFERAVAAGVSHLDIAPRYGAAEDLIGPLVPAVRDRLFVGCKTTRRNADGVRAQLEESLTKLGCESFDLYQMHAVTDLD